MRYDNLVFTETDKERIRENIKSINQWIIDNVVPYLAEDERIYIDYGDKYQAPGSWDSTTDFHLAVYGKENTIYGYSRKSTGYVGIGDKYGGISDAILTVSSPYRLFPVIDNWTLIKNRLLREVEDRKTKRMEIYSFTV